MVDINLSSDMSEGALVILNQPHLREERKAQLSRLSKG